MRTLAARRPGAGLWRVWVLTLCLGLALTAPRLGATGLQPAAPSQAAEPEAKAWYDRPMLTLLVALGGVVGTWLALARQQTLVNTLRARGRELSEQLEVRSETLENADGPERPDHLIQLQIREPACPAHVGQAALLGESGEQSSLFGTERHGQGEPVDEGAVDPVLRIGRAGSVLDA